jgi:hypothetical protein
VTNLYSVNTAASPANDGLHNLYGQPPYSAQNGYNPQTPKSEQVLYSSNPRYSSGSQPPMIPPKPSQYMDFEVVAAAPPPQQQLHRRQTSSHAVKPNPPQPVARKSNNILPDFIDLNPPHRRQSAQRGNLDLGLGGPVPGAVYTENYPVKNYSEEIVHQPIGLQFEQRPVQNTNQPIPIGTSVRQIQPQNPRFAEAQVERRDQPIFEKLQYPGTIQLQPEPFQSNIIKPNSDKLNQLIERYTKKPEMTELPSLQLTSSHNVDRV